MRFTHIRRWNDENRTKKMSKKNVKKFSKCQKILTTKKNFFFAQNRLKRMHNDFEHFAFFGGGSVCP